MREAVVNKYELGTAEKRRLLPVDRAMRFPVVSRSDRMFLLSFSSVLCRALTLSRRDRYGLQTVVAQVMGNSERTVFSECRKAGN